MHPTVPPPPAPLISHNHHIQVQKALSGTVSCTNRAYARDTSRGLRVLCTSPAYARDRLVRDRRLQNSGFYTRQACAQVRLMHATLRYNAMGAITSFVDACHCVFVFDLFSVVCVCFWFFLLFLLFQMPMNACTLHMTVMLMVSVLTLMGPFLAPAWTALQGLGRTALVSQMYGTCHSFLSSTYLSCHVSWAVPLL